MSISLFKLTKFVGMSMLDTPSLGLRIKGNRDTPQASPVFDSKLFGNETQAHEQNVSTEKKDISTGEPRADLLNQADSSVERFVVTMQTPDHDPLAAGWTEHQQLGKEGKRNEEYIEENPQILTAEAALFDRALNNAKINQKENAPKTHDQGKIPQEEMKKSQAPKIGISGKLSKPVGGSESPVQSPEAVSENPSESLQTEKLISDIDSSKSEDFEVDQKSTTSKYQVQFRPRGLSPHHLRQSKDKPRARSLSRGDYQKQFRSRGESPQLHKPSARSLSHGSVTGGARKILTVEERLEKLKTKYGNAS